VLEHPTFDFQHRANGDERYLSMNTSYTKFDSEIHSDERAQVSESEYDEVMMLMAEDFDGRAGYGEWSTEIEKDYLGGYQNIISGPTYNGLDI
jgi:hypothetical protein